MTSSRRNNWTLGIVSIALFMVVLDNLVVRRAALDPPRPRRLDPVARVDSQRVRAGLRGAAADRCRARRPLWAQAHVPPRAGAIHRRLGGGRVGAHHRLLVAARAVQGMGAAMVTPLTLTLLAEAFPAARRGMALGVWSGISGSPWRLGPLVGGAVVQSVSWHWIFWINVPIGLVLLPLAAARLRESHGPNGSLDLAGLALASAGAFGIVFGLVRAQSLGWTSPAILASLGAGSSLVGVRRLGAARSEPMLPMSFFARRSFAVTNFASLTMYFGMFGSIFFLSQFMQDVLDNTPLQAGLKILVWTGATMVVAPLAGVFSERLGSRPFMLAGLSPAGRGAGLAGGDPLHRTRPTRR